MNLVVIKTVAPIDFESPQSNVDVLTTLVAWLQANGNRQALLSETGGGSTASCET